MYKYSALSSLDLNLLVENLSKRGCWSDNSSSNKPFNECNFIWRPINISTIEYYTWDYQTQIRACPSLQTFNHFEKTSAITSKSQLVRTLETYYKNNVEARNNNYCAFDTIPTTFLIRPGSSDQTMSGLSQKFFDLSNGIFIDEPMPEKHCQSNLWIIKPPNSNQGQHISVVCTWDELKTLVHKKVEDDCWIVQKYIERPLLYKERKFDFRVYTLVTSKNEIFIYSKIIIRTCSEEFDHNVENKFAHLSNYMIQVKSDKFGKQEDGNCMTNEDLNELFKTAFPDRTVTYEDHILPRVRDIIIDTVRGAKQNMNPKKRKYIFELFGYDFLIDEDLRTWLLEVNANPELVPPNIKFQDVFYKMVDDLFEITLDPIFPPTAKNRKKTPNDFELIYCEEFSKFNSLPISKRRPFTESTYPILDFNPHNVLNTSKASSQQHKRIYQKRASFVGSDSDFWLHKMDSMDEFPITPASMQVSGNAGSNTTLDKNYTCSLQILITGPESVQKKTLSHSNSFQGSDYLKVPQPQLTNRSFSSQNLGDSQRMESTHRSNLSINMGNGMLDKSYLSIPSQASFLAPPSARNAQKFLALPSPHDSLNVSRSTDNNQSKRSHRGSPSPILGTPVIQKSQFANFTRKFSNPQILTSDDFNNDFSSHFLSRSTATHTKTRSSIINFSESVSIFSPDNLNRTMRLTPHLAVKRGSTPNHLTFSLDESKVIRVGTPSGKYYHSVERKSSRSPDLSTLSISKSIFVDAPPTNTIETLHNSLVNAIRNMNKYNVEQVNTQVKTTLMQIARPSVINQKDVQDAFKIIDLLSKSKHNLIPNSRSNTVVFLNLLHSKTINGQIRYKVLQNLSSITNNPDNRRKMLCSNLIHELSNIALMTCSENPRDTFDSIAAHESLRCLIKIGDCFQIRNFTKYKNQQEEFYKDFFIRHGGFLTIWTVSLKSNDERLKKFARDNFLNHIFQVKYWERQLTILDEQIHSQFDRPRVVFLETAREEKLKKEEDEEDEEERKKRLKAKEKEMKFSMPKLFLSMFQLEDLRKELVAKCKSLKLFHDKSHNDG